jgi:hypothetical protein
MNSMRGGGSDLAERLRGVAPSTMHDTGRTIVPSPLTLAGFGADGAAMKGGAKAAAAPERSWAGLGAMTVMVFATIAYATLFGTIELVSALRAVWEGHPDTLRSLLAAVLLAPAVGAAITIARGGSRRRSGASAPHR